MSKIINIRKVKKLIKDLYKLDDNLVWNEKTTPDIEKIEKELVKREIMDSDGQFITTLPDALWKFIDKVYR